MDQNVGQFEVPVDDVKVVDGLEAFDDLAHKIPSFLLRELTPDLEKFLQVPAIAVLHEQVKVVDCLLNVMQLYHIGMLDP